MGDHSERRTVENGPINAVRITAAIIVVIGHARALLFVDWADASHDPATAIFYAATSLGHQAVLVFFVLSGFWVGGSTWKRVRTATFTWRRYLTDRLTRLWIVLIPALALTVMIDAIGRAAYGSMSTYTNDPSYHHVADANPIDFPTVLGNIFFMGGIRLPTLGSNGPLWSLSYEFWMYILGPLAMLALYPTAGKRLIYILGFIALIPITGPEVMIYLPTWLLGVVVARYAKAANSILQQTPKAVSIFARILTGVSTAAVCLIARQLTQFPQWTTDYAVAICASLFLITLSAQDLPARPAMNFGRSYANMARFSYSIYAIHLPLLVLFTSTIGVFAANRWSFSLGNIGKFGLIIAGTMVIGWAFYALTESRTQQVRDYTRGRLSALGVVIQSKVKN